MSKSNTHETELLQLYFQNANAAGIGDPTGLRGSSTAGSVHISLHSADPGEAGDQSTNEISYAGPYARVAVARNATQWDVTGNTASNNNAITFAKRTDVGSVTATHFGCGDDPSGAGKLRYSGALDSNLVITQNIQPNFPAGNVNFTED